MGSFGADVKPHGRLSPHIPLKLHEMVKMSERYICNGSPDFSPMRNAAVGEVGVAMAAEICRRFRFSNEETRQIVELVENHMRFMDAQRMKDSTLKRFFRLERFEEHLALHRMDCMAASGNLENWEFVRDRWRATPEEAVRPLPLLTGRELIAEGYQPGAAFKAMLRAVEDAQLEGAIATPEEALRLVRKRFPKAD